MKIEQFYDRQEAGRMLAEQLKSYAHKSDVMVLALPRGGVPVAYEIARALAVPLDVFIVRKLGVPGQEELAMGAIAVDGIIVFNDEIIAGLNIPTSVIENVIQSEQKELQRRQITYRGHRAFPNLKDKTIILVDDGIATGATMRAAIKALQQKKPARIIVAVPVAAIETCKEISVLVDKFICLLRPKHFYGVGAWYTHFLQTTDEEVHELLASV